MDFQSESRANLLLACQLSLVAAKADRQEALEVELEAVFDVALRKVDERTLKTVSGFEDWQLARAIAG